MAFRREHNSSKMKSSSRKTRTERQAMQKSSGTASPNQSTNGRPKFKKRLAAVTTKQKAGNQPKKQ